ncbi:complement factor H-like isoform X2 [Tachypleus tridentatus]
MTCKILEAPVGGKMVLTSEEITSGSIAVFSCDVGRTLVGSHILKCMENGMWTFDVPKCYKNCVLPHLNNGNIGKKRITYWDENEILHFDKIEKNTSLAHGEKVVIRCNRNYWYKGFLNSTWKNNEITCNDGQWSSEPVCLPARCNSAQLSNWQGVMTGKLKNVYDHNELAFIHCAVGYKKISDIRCIYGLWKLLSGSHPCEYGYCQKPIINGGSVKESSWGFWTVDAENEYYEEGKKLYVNCMDNDERIIECRNGQWKPDLYCSEKKITTPSTTTFISRESIKSTCQIVNNDTYLIIFNNLIQVKTGDKVENGGKIRFHCHLGGIKRLIGIKEIYCINGEWSEDFPYCSDAKDPDQVVVFVAFSNDSLVPEGPGGVFLVPLSASLKMMCKTVAGSPGITWTTTVEGNIQTNLIHFKGNEILSIEFNATKSHTGNYTCSHHAGDSVLVQVLVTEETEDRTEAEIFTGNHTLEPTTNQELQKHCKLGFYDQDLRIFSEGHSVKMGDLIPDGASIIFHCHPVGRSRLFGIKKTYCHKGEWNDITFPSCQTNNAFDDVFIDFSEEGIVSEGGIIIFPHNKKLYLNCHTVEERNYKNAVFQTDVQGVRSKVCWRFRCKYVYIQLYTSEEDSGNYTCGIPGGKSVSVQISIQKTECPEIPRSRGLEVNYENNRKFNSIVSFTCQEPLHLIGTKEAKCLTTGKWSEQTPFCYIKGDFCPPVLMSEGLVIRYSNKQNKGSWAVFSCEPPLQLDGPQRLTCQDDGRWSGIPPACIHGSKCKVETLYKELPPDITPNVTKMFYDTNEEVDVFCHNEEFIIVEPTAVYCLAGGNWHVPELKCERGCRPLRSSPGSSVIIKNPKPYYLFGEAMILECPEGQYVENNVFQIICLSFTWSQSSLPNCVNKTNMS